MIPTLMVFGKDTKKMMQTCFKDQYEFMTNLTHSDPDKISIPAIGDGKEWPALTNFKVAFCGDMKNIWAVTGKGSSHACKNPCHCCNIKKEELGVANENLCDVCEK